MNKVIVAPQKKRFQLIFDVETTGLLPKQSRIHVPISLDSFPTITQLSFVVYDLIDNKIVQTFNSYIQLPPNMTLTNEVTQITGITASMCEQGKPIVEALVEFYKAYSMCDGIVAHNLDFDEKMILIELERNVEDIAKIEPRCLSLFRTVFEETKGMERYCTMRKGTALCNIVIDSPKSIKGTKIKWPKLRELYETLFEEPAPKGLHNAIIDVHACLQCYLKMRHNMIKPNM